MRFFSAKNSALGTMVLAFVALSLLLSVALSIAMIKSTSSQLDNRIKSALEADLQGFMDLYDQRRLIGVREGMERRSANRNDDTLIFMLLNRDGSRLGGNIENWPAKLIPNGSFQTIEYPKSDSNPIAYIGVGQTLRGGFDFMVARSTAQNDEVITNQILVAVAVTALLTVMGALVGLILSRRILQQINRINSVAAKIEAGYLHERVPLITHRNEFYDLAANINSMLDKISSNQERMNTLSENLAHELRTPLNRIKKTVYRLSSQTHLDQAELERSVDDIRCDVDATMRTFDAVLEIVTTHHAVPDKTRFSSIDLVSLINELLVLFEPVGEERGLTFVVNMLPRGTVLGERQLLLQMISNVIDNALKFAPKDSEVLVELFRDSTKLKLRIANQSEVLPGDVEDMAFTQFQRGANARETKGYGLGLPLVKAIATRHDFDLRIYQDNGRFTVEFSCPPM